MTTTITGDPGALLAAVSLMRAKAHDQAAGIAPDHGEFAARLRALLPRMSVGSLMLLMNALTELSLAHASAAGLPIEKHLDQLEEKFAAASRSDATRPPGRGRR